MEDQNNNIEEQSTEEVQEESQAQEEQQQIEASPEELVSSEILEVEWEKVANIFSGKGLVNQMSERLGLMCVQFERTKQKMVKEMSDIESILYQEGAALKESLNIDPNLTYELKLPATEGEKAFFIRKDQ